MTQGGMGVPQVIAVFDLGTVAAGVIGGLASGGLIQVLNHSFFRTREREESRRGWLTKSLESFYAPSMPSSRCSAG